MAIAGAGCWGVPAGRACTAARTMVATLLLVLATVPARAQLLADPRVPWQTADSAHFRIHYRAAQRAQAEAVASAAERVYPRVTQALQWEPRSRTELVVYTEVDLANGFTTPLPFNLIGVFLAPPDEGELLDNSPWLDLLLVHEFTHAVHLDQVRGAPRVLQSIFGRLPWFIPNLFQPGWVTEGLAVYDESDPAAGRGRLKSPLFEAWLRAERARGFLALAEINADGRALPLAKEYLYGAYFFEFLARRYGRDKIAAYVDQSSGNLVPRLKSNPVEMTGKTMDRLWDEFLADLAAQVDARAAPLLAQPETLGPRRLGPLFKLASVAAMPDGSTLAVVDGGLHAPHLVRLPAEGPPQPLVKVNADAHLDVAPDGGVLLTQPDICNTLYLAYDVYRLRGERLEQLTNCAHLRRAVQAGPEIAALQLDDGRTRLVRLAAEPTATPEVLFAPTDGTELLDLAAAPDGRHLGLITHRGADWRIVEFDLEHPGLPPRTLLRRAAPMQGLEQGPAGIEVIADVDGVYNVWRLRGDRLERLTHTHTAVVAQTGTAADGALTTVVLAPQGYALHRLANPTTLQSVPADDTTTAGAAVTSDTRGAPPPFDPGPVPEPATVLGDGQPYAAWRSVYPRSWLPAAFADRGLSAVGASTAGADALGWHQYAALLEWETSQKQLLGSVEYLFLGSHGLALSRTLQARAWAGSGNDEQTTVYDSHVKAQWLSLFPWDRLERRVAFGVGAALDRIEQVDVASDSSTHPQDQRLLAALVDIDTSNSNWTSEGLNRGLHATLLYESYRPFAHDTSPDAPAYDGGMLRTDLRGYLPLGRSVLALRWTEALASGSTQPFQLGGATDQVLQLGPVLDNRQLSLRGYRGDEPKLIGSNARVVSTEWRLPLADIDRHAMVPAVGIDRLSAAVFFDVGGAWNEGRGPDRWRRGVGVELLGEIKLLYALGLQLRLGLASGLDEPRSTQAYLKIGRAF